MGTTRIHHSKFSAWFEHQGLHVRLFAAALGVRRATVYAWLAGRTPSTLHLKALHARHPEVDLAMFTADKVADDHTA